MSTQSLCAISIGFPSRYAHEEPENLLAVSKSELATLRFSIILTGRWEVSASDDIERRGELRVELAELRRRYSQKIDEIAMTFGIQSAMNAKEEVERTVAIPLGMDQDLTATPREDENHHF